MNQDTFGRCSHSYPATTMNTRPVIETSSNPIALSASFNQDASCFAVGLDTGFCSMCSTLSRSCKEPLTSLPVFNSEPCQLRVSRGKCHAFSQLAHAELDRFQRRHRGGTDAWESQLHCSYWRRQATKVSSKQGLPQRESWGKPCSQFPR